ncbi:NnrT protein [Jannaschia formosa]|uniref:NnrT protein n=1 Tax=Jannaschia formosa TaxID=2259592 RepID=UPI000E1B833C|nr:NnrT protein [Jannaschia formosa]TFL17260.1 NnrT protein [Jannaschia formosa]
MTRRGWDVPRIALALYPFGAGAMAVNVFFASLIGSWVGLPVLSTSWSIALGALIGLPATWAFAGHIRALMDEAEQKE